MWTRWASVAPLLRAVIRRKPRPFVRALASTSKPKPLSKLKKKNRKENFHSKWLSVNDPKLLAKNLRYAERRASAAGDIARIQAFDEAAAAFPNPSPIMAATLLERANIVTRDLEDWEQAFLEFQADVEDETAKSYPPEMMDRLTAGSKIKEGGDGDGAGGSAGGTNLQQFYSSDAFADADLDSLDITDFRAAPRETEADRLKDTRSLDRALSQRLVLLVRRKDDGSWWFPQAAREDGDRMVDVAQRGATDAYGTALDVWYPGNAPIGFWLNVYDSSKQERTGVYGEKVFFYRAQLFKGRLELGEDFDDYKWLTRGELVLDDVLDRKTKHYLHAVIGAGPGEEHWRRQRSASAHTPAEVEE